MLAAYRRSMALPARVSSDTAAMPVRGSRDDLRRPNWGAIAIVVLLHVGLVFALVQLDVIPISRPEPQLTVVTLIPDTTPAPPPPEEEIVPVKPVEPQIFIPKPVVVAPAPAPRLAVTAELPPPEGIAVAAPAPTPTPGPPAPVTAPDASAASLGNPSPRYPIESRRKREEGTVRLRVVITDDGRVKEIGVARSSGSERLDKAALDTVRRWKFRPGMQAGRAVEAIGFLNIPFKLSA